eukprot:280054-Prymnesium_polylepis.1
MNTEKQRDDEYGEGTADSYEAGGMTGTGRGRAAESGGGIAVTAAARGGKVDQGDESRCYPVELCVLIGSIADMKT